MSMILSVILWLMIGTATAYFATQRGRDPFIWFALGMLFGILGLLLLFLMPSLSNPKEEPTSSGPSMIELLPQQPEENYLIKEWFYLDKEHHQQGPIPFQGLKTLWNESKLDASSFVWFEGMPQWKRIEELPVLQETLLS